MLYRKIFKALLAALFVSGLVASAFGFFNEWPDSKKWKNDQSVLEDLPGVIAELKDAGAMEFTKSELEERKVEIDSLTSVAKAKSEEIADLIAKCEDKKTKKALKEEYTATIDSLTNEVIAVNEVISVYNNSVELERNLAELYQVAERIDKGNASVDTILYSTYSMIAMALIALFIVIFIITGINSPLGLVKIIVGLIIIAALVIGAWKLAPGTALNPDEYYHSIGAAVPTAGDLKLTDTILYLAYLLVGATVVSLVTSWVVGAIRK